MFDNLGINYGGTVVDEDFRDWKVADRWAEEMLPEVIGSLYLEQPGKERCFSNLPAPQHRDTAP